MDNKNLYWIFISDALRNVTAILACAFIAYKFNHWWILLFAIPFLTSHDYQREYHNDKKDTNEKKED